MLGRKLRGRVSDYLSRRTAWLWVRVNGRVRRVTAAGAWVNGRIWWMSVAGAVRPDFGHGQPACGDSPAPPSSKPVVRAHGGSSSHRTCASPSRNRVLGANNPKHVPAWTESSRRSCAFPSKAPVSADEIDLRVLAMTGMMKEIVHSLPRPWPADLAERVTSLFLHGVRPSGEIAVRPRRTANGRRSK